jgi:hypothetical protein
LNISGDKPVSKFAFEWVNLCRYGMSGRAITVPWTSFVAKGLVVKGFSLRQWMSNNKKKAGLTLTFLLLETVMRVN